jgi:hypothetical protein
MTLVIKMKGTYLSMAEYLLRRHKGEGERVRFNVHSSWTHLELAALPPASSWSYALLVEIVQLVFWDKGRHRCRNPRRRTGLKVEGDGQTKVKRAREDEFLEDRGTRTTFSTRPPSALNPLTRVRKRSHHGGIVSSSRTSKACLGHVAQQAYYTQPNHYSQNDIVPPTLALDEAQ